MHTFSKVSKPRSGCMDIGTKSIQMQTAAVTVIQTTTAPPAAVHLLQVAAVQCIVPP